MSGAPGLVGLPAPPAELAARLPAPGTRPDRKPLHTLVAELCAWRPLGARVLAGLLGRKDFRPLVRDHLRACEAFDPR